jgi:uncharacterized protein YecE (DUF72 family)
MKKGLFMGLARAIPDNFRVLVKVPETITHEKGLGVDKGVMEDLFGFIDKVSLLNDTNKLGAIIIRIPQASLLPNSKKWKSF